MSDCWELLALRNVSCGPCGRRWTIGPSDKDRRLGGCSTGKSFRFVCACVRAVWLPSGIGSQIPWVSAAKNNFRVSGVNPAFASAFGGAGAPSGSRRLTRQASHWPWAHEQVMGSSAFFLLTSLSLSVQAGDRQVSLSGRWPGTGPWLEIYYPMCRMYHPCNQANHSNAS